MLKLCDKVFRSSSQKKLTGQFQLQRRNKSRLKSAKETMQVQTFTPPRSVIHKKMFSTEWEEQNTVCSSCSSWQLWANVDSSDIRKGFTTLTLLFSSHSKVVRHHIYIYLGILNKWKIKHLENLEKEWMSLSWLVKFCLRSWGSRNSEHRRKQGKDKHGLYNPSPTDPSVCAAFGPTTSEESAVLNGVSNCLAWIWEASCFAGREEAGDGRLRHASPVEQLFCFVL